MINYNIAYYSPVELFGEREAVSLGLAFKRADGAILGPLARLEPLRPPEPPASPLGTTTVAPQDQRLARSETTAVAPGTSGRSPSVSGEPGSIGLLSPYREYSVEEVRSARG